MRVLPNPERAWPSTPPAPGEAQAMIEARIGPGVESFSVLSGGRRNLNVRVGTERVVRIFMHDASAARREEALLRRPWQHFRVPKVLERGDDFLVLEWIDLRLLRDSRSAGAALGRAASEIHRASYDRPGYLDPALELARPLPRVAEYLKRALSSDAVGGPVRTAVERLADRLQEELDLGVPVLNHGDFKAANLFNDEVGRLVILDWELAFAGPALMDLGQLFRWRPSAAFRDGFVQTYRAPSGALPADWLRRAAALDVLRLVDLAARAGPGTRCADDVVSRLGELLGA